MVPDQMEPGSPCDLADWLERQRAHGEALWAEIVSRDGPAIAALLETLRQEWAQGLGQVFRHEQPREEAESCQVMTQ